MGLLKEFKEFALKGNVLDLAVAVIIGGAFGKIVSSIIDDLIMPIVGKIIRDVDFTNLYVALSDQPAGLSLKEARDKGAVLAYGNFLTITINFVILAACVFMVVKLFNTARKKMEAKEAAAPPPPPPPPTKEELLLTEIRDLLARR